jgi:uncharacterized protein GlcG (DUF336 family)
MKRFNLMSIIVAFALASLGTVATAQDRAPYGTPVNLETAKKIAAGVMAEAKKNNWRMAVAVADNHGMLVYYGMMDDTQTASAVIAVEKARSSATLRRPTKELE